MATIHVMTQKRAGVNQSETVFRNRFVLIAFAFACLALLGSRSLAADLFVVSDPSIGANGTIIVCVGTKVTVTALLNNYDCESPCFGVTIADQVDCTNTPSMNCNDILCDYNGCHSSPATVNLTISGCGATDQTLTIYWQGLVSVCADPNPVCPGGTVTATVTTGPLLQTTPCSVTWTPGSSAGNDVATFGSTVTTGSPGTVSDPAGCGAGFNFTIQASMGGACPNDPTGTGPVSTTVDVGAWGAWQANPDALTLQATSLDPQCVNYRAHGNAFMPPNTDLVNASATVTPSGGTWSRTNGCGTTYDGGSFAFNAQVTWSASGTGVNGLGTTACSGSGTAASFAPSAGGTCTVQFTATATVTDPCGGLHTFGENPVSTQFTVNRNDISEPIFTGFPPSVFSLLTTATGFSTPPVPLTNPDGVVLGTQWDEFSGQFSSFTFQQTWTPDGVYGPSPCHATLPLTTIQGWSVNFQVGILQTPAGQGFQIGLNPPQTTYYFFGAAECPPTPYLKWYGQVYRENVQIIGGVLAGSVRHCTDSAFFGGPVCGPWQSVTGSVPLTSSPQPRGAASQTYSTDCCP